MVREVLHLSAPSNPLSPHGSRPLSELLREVGQAGDEFYSPRPIVSSNYDINHIEQGGSLQPSQSGVARRRCDNGRLPAPLASTLKHGSTSSSRQGPLMDVLKPCRIVCGQFRNLAWQFVR